MKQRRQLLFRAGICALLLPLPAVAQSTASRLPIGWISVAAPGITLADFRDDLRALGYAGATEQRIEVRITQRDAASVRAAIDALLRLPVALIVATGPAAPLVHGAAAGRIPVVFAFSGDPVEAGLVQSLARPGGSTTGMSFLALELVGKRMELIKQIMPGMRRVAILANPQHPGEKAERRESIAAAERLGLQVAYVEFSSPEQFEPALERIRLQNCQGMVVFPDAGMVARAERIAAFALKEQLLCVSGWAAFAQAGCIASYGPSLRDGYRRLAHYADRVLHGVPPSSLPVELPARLEMVINLKSAKALGITIPQSVLLRADEVIQ